MKTIGLSKRALIPLLLVAALPACSDNFSACVNEWQTCTNKCPPSGPRLEAAEDDYRECIADCPPLDPNAPEAQQLAAGKCIKACGDAKEEAIEAATACNETCDDEFAECTGATLGCSDPTSAQHLLSINVADWAPHASAALDDPNHGVFVCEDHFPLASPERSEVVRAVQQFSWVPGSTIDLFALAQPHQNKSVLFSDPPAASTFDYVDNAADTFVHPCHPDNSTACSDNAALGIDGFAINTCSYASGAWNGAGDREFFSITANANCYDYYSNPASDDYVNESGALHELGHAAGMQHSGSWPAADLPYISTMQGNLEYLSAYDVAFLRERYPAAFAPSTRDFVASSKIRVDMGGPNEISGTFGEENPTRLYLVGDKLHDCVTKQPAVFRAAWFNTGNAAQEGDHCMMNELRLEDPATAHEARVVRWHAAAMPAESQDHWVGGSNAVASDFAGLSRGRHIDLVFEANVYEQYRERATNNTVKTPVQLFDTAACTPPPVPPVPQLPILQTGPTAYTIAGSFLNQVVADPLTIARGAVLAPAPVGAAGLGLRIKSLEDGSALKLMGAKVGDILWRVDGQPITGVNTAFVAMARLQAGSTVSVAYARGSAMRQATYKKQ